MIYCKSCGDPVDGIVEIVSHECDEILHLDALSDSEKSTLLYVEAKVVDNLGKLSRQQMNYEDDQNLKLFTAAGLLEVKHHETTKHDVIMKVTSFSDHAWDLAAECRKDRAEL